MITISSEIRKFVVINSTIRFIRKLDTIQFEKFPFNEIKKGLKMKGFEFLWSTTIISVYYIMLGNPPIKSRNKLVFVSSIIWFSHAKTQKINSFNSFAVKNEKNEAFHFLCFYAFLT